MTWKIIKDHYNASHQIQKSKWFFSLTASWYQSWQGKYRTVKYWMDKAFIHLEKRQGKISSSSEQQFPRSSTWPMQLVKSNGPTGNTHSSVEGQLSLPVESEILKAESVPEYSSTHLSRTKEQIDIPYKEVGFLVAQQWRTGLQCRRLRRCRFDPWVRKNPWRREWQLTPVFLAGYNPMDRGVWQTTVQRVGHDWSDWALMPAYKEIISPAEAEWALCWIASIPGPGYMTE